MRCWLSATPSFRRSALEKWTRSPEKQGRTVLFVSHNHAAIRKLCTHGLVLRDGTASPKCDVVSALEDYASERQRSLASSWRRPSSLAKSAVHFATIDVHLESRQPTHSPQLLRCNNVGAGRIEGLYRS